MTILLWTACSSEEEKFELFSPEAFAYSLDSGWELNISCQAKGFVQSERNGNFITKLSYELDIKTPDGKTLYGVQDGLIDQTNKEKVLDVPINIQLQLNSEYAVGLYTITIKVTDNFNNKTVSISKPFELSN